MGITQQPACMNRLVPGFVIQLSAESKTLPSVVKRSIAGRASFKHFRY